MSYLQNKHQQQHEKLIELLNQHPSLKGNLKVKSDAIGSDEFSDLDINEINQGVRILATAFNLTGGSVGDFNLYKLLQVYFREPEKREKINEILR